MCHSLKAVTRDHSHVEQAACCDATAATTATPAHRAIVFGWAMLCQLQAKIKRGWHGSFSAIEVHDTPLAVCPGFQSSSLSDPLPGGNVDLAATIAALSGLSMPKTQSAACTKCRPSQPLGAAAGATRH